MLTLVNKFSSILEPLSRVKGFCVRKGFPSYHHHPTYPCSLRGLGKFLSYIRMYLSILEIGELSFICMEMFTAKVFEASPESLEKSSKHNLIKTVICYTGNDMAKRSKWILS